MSTPRDSLEALCSTFIRVMSGGSLEDVMAIRTEQCIQYTLPPSLKAPAMSNEEYSAFYTKISASFKNFRLELVQGAEPIIDELSRRMVLRLKSSADGPNGKYNNEYVIFLRGSKCGTLLEEVTEFVDSAYTLDYFKAQDP